MLVAIVVYSSWIGPASADVPSQHVRDQKMNAGHNNHGKMVVLLLLAKLGVRRGDTVPPMLGGGAGSTIGSAGTPTE